MPNDRTAYHKAYYQRNKERLRANAKAKKAAMSAEEHARELAYSRAYYAAHEEEAAAYRARRWAAMTEEQREAHRAVCRAWARNNPERRKAQQANYRDRNRDQINARRRAVYAAKKEANA